MLVINFTIERFSGGKIFGYFLFCITRAVFMYSKNIITIYNNNCFSILIYFKM